MQRYRERVVDAALTVALAVLAVASVLTDDPTDSYDVRAPNAVAVALALAASLPLAVRRRWPLAVCVTVMLATFTVTGFGWRITPFCVLLALFTVAARTAQRAALNGLLIGYAGVGVLAIGRVPLFDHPLALVFVLAMTTAWIVGRVMRRRRVEHESAVAEALAAERARAAEAERAVLAERLHIARELHDVISHTLSVIAVQAGTARHRVEHGPAEDRPEGVVPALSAIETASRAALDDLRRMLGLLRVTPPPTAGPTPPSTGHQGAGPVREWIVDAAVAGALAAIGIGIAFVPDPSVAIDYPDPNAGLVALILLACLPLAVRRRWPFTVYLVSAAATVTTIAVGWQSDYPGFATFVALYTVAAWRPLPVTLLALGLMAAIDLVLLSVRPPNYQPFDDLGFPLVLVPFALGLLVRRWRRDRDAALARALEAERTRAVAAERAVFAERLRIAGELHDVITHTLSAVAVQSAVARHRLGDRAGPAGPALAAVEQASRVALDDLRRMLHLLDRQDTAALAPSPGLAELDLLASAHRAAHGPVELTVDPTVRQAPESVRMTAFRLVQEALTNVRKHAPGAPARVSVSRSTDGAVTVRVEDDGPPQQRWPYTPADGGGFGIAGMRERAALFGGHVEAGPRPEGGFQVQATLPGPDSRTVAA